MGTWSAPLFTVCCDKDGKVLEPATVRLQLDKVPTRLSGNGICGEVTQNYDGTLEAAIMSACESAKVMGHLSAAAMRDWDTMFAAVLRQNPEVAVAEAHWWCSDEQRPYLMAYFRTQEAAVQALDWFNCRTEQTYTLLGSCGHALWTDPELHLDDEEEYPFRFRADKYRAARLRHPKVFSTALEDVTPSFRPGQI